MPQSLSKNYIHLIFSTHDRTDLMPKDRLSEIFSYISGVLSHNDCPTICVGGIQNHIHILFILSRKMALSDAVRLVKSNTSKWINDNRISQFHFNWQNGFGAFSVSQSQIETVRKYILNQEEHHHKMSFKDEYRKFLDAYGLEYNEQYMWD